MCKHNHFSQGRFTYIILNQRTSLFKIGCSNNPYDRLQKFKVVDRDLVMIAVNMDGNFEIVLHEFFNERRRCGEWFELTVEDLLGIFSLKGFLINPKFRTKDSEKRGWKFYENDESIGKHKTSGELSKLQKFFPTKIEGETISVSLYKQGFEYLLD